MQRTVFVPSSRQQTEARFKNILPTRVTTLIGREQELEIVSALLRLPDVRLLTLTGVVRSRFTSSVHWTATQYKQAWMSLQTDLSRRSSQGKLVVAQNSGHFIQIDRPNLVITSIHEIIIET